MYCPKCGKQLEDPPEDELTRDINMCADCVYFDAAIEGSPCEECLKTDHPLNFTSRMCITCKHNSEDPEKEPCRKCMQDFNNWEGHSNWEEELNDREV